MAICLGKRLYEHFHGSVGNCKPTEFWEIPPRYIICIPAPDNAKWERLSLEEYLIQYFDPYENKLMKRK